MICQLAKSSEIEPDKWYEYSLQTDTGLQSVMLMKQQDQFLAYLNSCPHQGRRLDYAPGEFLTGDDGLIICPAHGAEFNPNDGLCVSGPCQGQSLQALHVQVTEETVFVVIQ